MSTNPFSLAEIPNANCLSSATKLSHAIIAPAMGFSVVSAEQSGNRLLGVLQLLIDP